MGESGGEEQEEKRGRRENCERKINERKDIIFVVLKSDGGKYKMQNILLWPFMAT